MRQLHGQRENGDVIEIVADFAYHLAHPHVAVIVVSAEKIEKFTHQACRLLAEPGFAAGRVLEK
jgi:hypothetical protein